MATLQKRFSNAYGRLCHFVAIRHDPASVNAAEDGVIRAAIYLADNVTARTAHEIAANTRSLFSLSFTDDEVAKSIARLAENAQVMRNSDGSISLTATAVSELERCIDASQSLEREVRAEWFQQLAEAKLLVRNGHSSDEIWHALQHYLASMFTRHGVQTLELMVPTAAIDESADIPASDILAKIVKSDLPHFSQEVGRQLLQSFFTNRTTSRDRYLSELLDGTFSFFALTVDDETRKVLQENIPALKLFVDTNFIFGLLGLHYDVFVVLAKQLVELIREQQFPFQLYYHPLTAIEFHNVMQFYHRRLAGGSWPSAISKALLKAGDMPDVERKFHTINAEHPISVDDFFARYENIDRLLEFANIKPYRHSYEAWLDDTTTQDLIGQYKRYLEPREKPLNSLRHDIVVWRTIQAVRHNRPTLLGEDAFFITCDYSFWRFDHKNLSRRRTGVSVLPNVLLQLLRPFVPRTQDFDQGFVNTFALPEFRTIHVASPQAVSRVAGIMRLYADLPEDVAVAILTDDALLTKVTRLDESDPTIKDLVESAIIAEANRWKAEAERLRGEIEKEQATTKDVSDALAVARRAADDHVQALGAVREQLATEHEVRVAAEASAAAERTAREQELDRHGREIAAASERASQAEEAMRKTAMQASRMRAISYALIHLLVGFAICATFVRYYMLTVREYNAMIIGALVYVSIASVGEVNAWFSRRRQRVLARVLWFFMCLSGVWAAWVTTEHAMTFSILVGALVTLATALVTALLHEV
jgi:hypothetical protein